MHGKKLVLIKVEENFDFEFFVYDHPGGFLSRKKWSLSVCPSVGRSVRLLGSSDIQSILRENTK